MKKKGDLSHVEITLGLVLVMSLVAVAFIGSHQDIKPKAEVTERF